MARTWIKAHPRDWPQDRAVQGWSSTVPYGYRLGEGTVHICQRGMGATGGLWFFGPDGSTFLPDDGDTKRQALSGVFTHYAELQPFDGEP